MSLAIRPLANRSTFSASAARARLRRISTIVALVLMSALGASLVNTDRASAYTSLFRPFLKNPLPDPCKKLGVRSNGGLVVRQWKPGVASIPRFIALLCGPKVPLPSHSIYLVDDQIWKFYMGKNGNTDLHMLRGGATSLPWNRSISTKLYPFLKGPDGAAPAFDIEKLNKERIEELSELIGAVLKLRFGAKLFLCIVGALETEGESCLPLLISFGITNALQVAKVTAILIDGFEVFIKSREAMAGADWFYWSDNYGFWNFLGDVKPDWIDPSITMTGLGEAGGRIGVVLSNVGVDQGPDFHLGSSRARRDPEFARLARFAARIRANRGRPLIGTGRNDVLVGTRHHDAIDGRNRHDRILGRSGDDTILQGGPGHDRVYGGPGDDNIDGYRGRDRLFGGPGNDQIIDLYGPTVIRTGGGADLVIVRDGRGDDVVLCGARNRGLIRIDRGDRIARSCRTAPIRVMRGGPRMKIGRGY